jgi:hypothetical protein
MESLVIRVGTPIAKGKKAFSHRTESQQPRDRKLETNRWRDEKPVARD